MASRIWRIARLVALASCASALVLTLAAILLDRAFPLPADLTGELSTLVTDRAGAPLRLFTTATGKLRLATSPEEVAPAYLDLLLSYEDRRFYAHPGVDPLALGRAGLQWATRGHVVSGGSTITMQVARLLEPRRRTIFAKLIQIGRALQLEARLSKREILALYLTRAPFGGNVEGVRAASLIWFGKRPADLDAAEAALLVALPRAPEALRPDRHADRARQARDQVLARALASGAITDTQAREAAELPVPDRRQGLAFSAPHLAGRLRAANRGASVLRSTIDLPLQKAVESLAKRAAERLDRHSGLAILVVDNHTREIRAYVGAPDFFDETRQGQIDMARARRSPGSLLKPFIYGLGFDDLIVHPDSMLEDVPTRFGDYQPENFDRAFRGQVTAREALRQSLNIPAVTILERVGPLRFESALRASGAVITLPSAMTRPGLPLALGGLGISLQDSVALFAGLATGGEMLPITTLVETPAALPRRMISETAANALTEILRGVPPPPGYVAAGVGAGRQIAYKTGTSYGFRDAWAVGYDDDTTIGVWTGRPDGTPSPDRLGRTTAAPILFQAFDLLPAPPPRADPLGAPLPVGLAALKSHDGSDASQLKIRFPLSGTTLELALGEPLALRATGGQRPLTWLVDGRPLPSPGYRRDAVWRPEGPGFVRISVIDAAGRSAEAEVRVKAP